MMLNCCGGVINIFLKLNLVTIVSIIEKIIKIFTMNFKTMILLYHYSH